MKRRQESGDSPGSRAVVLGLPVPPHQSPEDTPEEATCWTEGRATGERRGRDLLQALTQESGEGRTGLGQKEPRPSPEGTGWTVL